MLRGAKDEHPQVNDEQAADYAEKKRFEAFAVVDGVRAQGATAGLSSSAVGGVVSRSVSLQQFPVEYVRLCLASQETRPAAITSHDAPLSNRQAWPELLHLPVPLSAAT